MALVNPTTVAAVVAMTAATAGMTAVVTAAGTTTVAETAAAEPVTTTAAMTTVVTRPATTETTMALKDWVGMTMAARVRPVTKAMRLRWAVEGMTMLLRWAVQDMTTLDTTMPVRPKPHMTIQHTITLIITKHPVTKLCGALWLSPSTPAAFGPPQWPGLGWRSHSIP